jgi:hypothetical protein
MRIDASRGQPRSSIEQNACPLERQALRSTSRVSRVLFRALVTLGAAAIIPLGRPLPAVSSSLPAGSGESPFPVLPKERRAPAYAALLPMGFAVPPALPRARWALTPPFHPYLPRTPTPAWAGREREGQAVCFLWHSPRRFRHRALPGIALCGARTFLPPRRLRARTGDRLHGVDARRLALRRPRCAQCAWMKLTIFGTTSPSRP